jgi:hypothetical protein
MAGIGMSYSSAQPASKGGGFGGGVSPSGASAGRGTAQSPVQNTAKVLQALQSVSKPSPAAAMPVMPATPTTLKNTASPNTTIENIISTLGERAKGGMGAPEAIRLAQRNTRDMLSGTLKEMQGLAARRGVGGSGAESIMQGKEIGKAQRTQAGQAADISYKAEQDRNQLMQDTAGLAGMSEGLQGAQQERGISQYVAQQNAELGRYNAQANASLQQQQQDQNAQNNLFSIMTQLF